MKRKLLMIACILTNLFVSAKSNALFPEEGELRGKITEKGTSKPMSFASIAIVRDDKIVTGTSADVDGNYKIKPLSPGSYSVKAIYTGCQPLNINQVLIASNSTTYLDIELVSENNLPPVEITWTPPLISEDGIDYMSTISSYEIKNMPLRSVRDIVATAPGVIQKDSGGELYIRGSRSNSTKYIVDGIKMPEFFSLPISAIAEITVITGGIPAQFGDATGGIVVITTKSYAGK